MNSPFSFRNLFFFVLLIAGQLMASAVANPNAKTAANPAESPAAISAEIPAAISAESPAATSTATSAAEMAVIKGKVVNERNEPVEYATAVLLNPVTGEVVKGEVCNATGEFNITRIGKGEYVLSVSMVGYRKVDTEKLVVDGKRSVIERTVVLNEQTELLKTVEVVAKKDFVEQTVDKLVINPEASVTSASDNVYDILQKLPGVSIDTNDNITLKGMQGVRVLIDDKPTYLSASQLASWLKSMQAKEVERIEIIENPSARYDAEGNSGIINIKTKHTRAPGFNGSVNGGLSLSNPFTRKEVPDFDAIGMNPVSGATGFAPATTAITPASTGIAPASTSAPLGWNGGINLNMNYGKLNVYGSYSNNHWSGWNTMDAVRRYTGTDLLGASQLVRNNADYAGSAHNYKAGADYSLARNQVLSVMVRGNRGSNKEGMRNQTDFRDTSGVTDSLLITRSDGHNNWRNTTWNMNYKWDIDTLGQSLLVDVDYALFGFNSANTQEGNYFAPDGADLNNRLLVVTSQGNDIRILSSKLDHVWPVTKKLNLESGLKFSSVTTESFIDMAGTLAQNDHFIYKEAIQAAYLNARWQLHKTSLQVGLRLENTQSTGNSVAGNQVNDTSYLKLFPSVFVQQQLSDKQNLNFRYSYRIGRPGYHHLNPFKWMVDPYTFNVGNPALKPQFTHTAALTHSYNSKFITALGASYTDGLFTEIIRQNDENRTVYQTMENLHSSLDLTLSETLQLQPVKGWRLNGTLTGMYKTLSLDEGEALRRFSVMGTMSNTFSLPAGIDLELSGRYNSSQLVSNVILRPRYSVDMGVQRKFFNSNATLKLAVTDLFNTNAGRAYARHSNVDIEVENRWSSRRLNLTFTYRFGKDDFKTRSNRATASSEEEMRSSK